MSAELINAVAESDAARRAEARLRSELDYERGRVAAANGRYDEAVQAVHNKDVELGEAWVYWTLLLGAGQPHLGVSAAASTQTRDSAPQPVRNYAAAAAAGIRIAPPPRFGVRDVLSGPEGSGPQLLDPSLERRLRSQMEELIKKQGIIGKLVKQAQK